MKKDEQKAAPENAENDGAEKPAAETAENAADAAAPAEEAPAEEAGTQKDKAEETPDEAAVWKDRFARLQADFDNFRKRQAREYADRVNQANADLIEDLLPTLDQIDHGVADLEKRAAEDKDNPYLVAYRMAHDTLIAALGKHGLEPIPSTVDAPLDTETTEALTVMATGQHKPGCVAFETRRGYRLNGKVLRAAQAVVEKEEDAAEPAPAENAAPEK